MKKIFTFFSLIFFTNFVLGQNTWLQKTNFGGTARQEATGFSIGTFGYIFTGNDGASKLDVWSWNQGTNLWTQKNNFPGTARKDACATSHSGKGYVFFGMGPGYLNEVWEYNPGSDAWTQKNNFPGTARRYSAAVSNGTKIYIIAGDPGTSPYLSDIWEYDPTPDTWVQKTSFPGGQRSAGVAFAIGNNIYYGTGNDNGASFATNDLWEFNPSGNSWVSKTSIPTGTSLRRTAGAFTLNNLGYVGLGWYGTTNNYNYDFWEYDAVGNTWTQRLNFAGNGAYTPVAFAIGNKGYFGTGGTLAGYTKQFWEYTPNPLGINELTSAENFVRLFPNPNNGMFKIQINKEIENAEIVLYNSFGQIVCRQIVKQGINDINSNELSHGLYNYILLSDKQKINSGKLIIE